MNEKMIAVFKLLTMLTPITNTLEFDVFGSFYCMILEEWCRSNGEDIVSYIQHIADTVKEVTEVYGIY